jgi:hypothetical protein
VRSIERHHQLITYPKFFCSIDAAIVGSLATATDQQLITVAVIYLLISIASNLFPGTGNIRGWT